MAGHSQFKNIMHRKGAQDKKRGKLFAKLAKEIVVAAKSGMADPEMNPRLRTAIATARSNNMPKDNIERAIKRGSGEGDGEVYDEIRYEGYGPGGVAVIVEALTDNRNRTASEVRSTFGKNGGNLGESGSVTFNFERCGAVTFDGSVGSADDVLEAAIEAGADDCESEEDSHTIYCEVESFFEVSNALNDQFGDPKEAGLIWKPNLTIDLDEDKASTMLKLIDALEDLDDVQSVHSNFEVSDEVMAKLAG